MTEDEPSLSWPGANDRIVVEEMLRDRKSKQWDECQEFVKRLVHVQAKNIPQDHREDLIQDVMVKVKKSLHTFRYQCKLSTWLFLVVQRSIIDARRKIVRAEQFIAPLDDPHDEIEREEEAFTSHKFLAVEEAYIVYDDLKEALKALQEYVSTHANPQRNKQILEMVLLEGRSLEEAAKKVGCSAPVVGYIVRSAQRFVREKLRHQS